MPRNLGHFLVLGILTGLAFGIGSELATRLLDRLLAPRPSGTGFVVT